MIPCTGTQDDSSDDYESASDITLHDEDDSDSHHFQPELVSTWFDNESSRSILFPFHLIAGCSTAERAMCQYSPSVTAQEVRKTVVVKARLTVPMTTPPHHDAGPETNGAEKPATRTPVLAHRMKHDKSILALAVSAQFLFAGTQGGEILVYSLDTYERRRKLLFSSATDLIVNVWCTSFFRHLYALWPPYDIGDIFCVAYSSYYRTVYLGAQNTSI
ncbi:hypothetical protein CC86DRAFT_470020 [Ophiobolus disseminans]|uniref:WD40 repeat-like protein n=1 Tax=Ophiobolus disseminans TaxID=1469910 RepID=A0A6A6ZMB1_9PLEO|nr:hypothetical protein CC86DRAFT_470020 [Ophiobolus disseminans]